MYNHDLGLITPDITRTLGLISPEGQRALSYSLQQPTTLLSFPVTTWGIIVGGATVGGAAAGYASSMSGRGALFGMLGGLIGSAGGMALAGYLGVRANNKLFESTQSA